MRIVVLDGYALNPGDLSWEELKTFGECVVYDRTPPDQVVTRAANAEILLTNKTVLSAEIIGRLPALKYIGVTATGYNIVDVPACRERGIVVTNIPAYSTESVAQLVFAHLMHLARNVAGHADGVRSGKWNASPDFAYWVSPQMELNGKTIGIVGYGSIGQAVGRIAQALGMNVIASESSRQVNDEQLRRVSLDVLFHTADVVTLHSPLSDATRQLVNEHRLSLMKPSAFLINTSRGGLVDETALAAALNDGKIAGAGLDVLSVEPPPADHPLLTARNCFITPHIAWTTFEARSRLMRIAVENVRAFLAGEPQNTVVPV